MVNLVYGFRRSSIQVGRNTVSRKAPSADSDSVRTCAMIIRPARPSHFCSTICNTSEVRDVHILITG